MSDLEKPPYTEDERDVVDPDTDPEAPADAPVSGVLRDADREVPPLEDPDVIEENAETSLDQPSDNSGGE